MSFCIENSIPQFYKLSIVPCIETLFANQTSASTNLQYTSLVCTTNIKFSLPNDQSFYGSSTTNFRIRESRLGNANIVCQIYFIHVVRETYFRLHERPSFANVTLR